jgi:hypothetical protein
MAAVGAACAIALKPFYFGCWLLAPFLSLRAARRPAFWLVPALGMLYLVLVSRTPFPSYLREWAAVYWRYGHRPWWFVTVGNPFALLPVGAALITAKSARATPLGAMLWAATLAAWLGAVGQGKAYPYHYLPAVGLSLLLLAYASRSSRRGVAVPVGLGWALYLLYFITVGAYGDRTAARELDRAVGPASVMVLSEAADHAWLLSTEYGRPWLSPHYNLWWLEISHGRDTVPGLPRWPEQNEILRHSLMTARLPEVLLLGEGVSHAAHAHGV